MGSVLSEGLPGVPLPELLEELVVETGESGGIISCLLGAWKGLGIGVPAGA